MNNKQWLCLSALVLGFLAVAAPKAHAGVGRDRATGQAIWDAAVNGRSTTIGGSNGSMRVIGPAGGATSGSTAGGAKIVGEGTVPVADKKVPGVGITGEVAKEAVVGGVVGCLTGGAVGCVLGVATPLALAYVANSGVRLNPETGAPERTDPTACTVGPCYEYKVLDWSSGPKAYHTDTWTRSKAAQLEMFKAWANSNGWQLTSCNPAYGDGWSCADATYNPSVVGNWEPRPASVQSPTWYPATPQEVRDQLYNNDPPPGIVDELARHGNIVWTLGDPTRVTLIGPAEVTGPKTTTTNPDGSKSVSQDRTPLSYSGPTVTAGPTTKTTETFAPDGTPTGTTTSTTEPGTEGESSPEEAPPTDTALPPLPSLYARKYPDGIVGIWNQKKDQLKNTELVSLATGLMPNIGNGGTCPSWPINFNWNEWIAYGSYNVAPPCWIWDVAKAILIFSALLLARSLIFGG